jgi:hypothetical protein
MSGWTEVDRQRFLEQNKDECAKMVWGARKALVELGATVDLWGENIMIENGSKLTLVDPGSPSELGRHIQRLSRLPKPMRKFIANSLFERLDELEQYPSMLKLDQGEREELNERFGVTDEGYEKAKHELRGKCAELAKEGVNTESLRKWQNERPLRQYAERKARGLIVSAIIRDEQRSKSGASLSRAEVLQRITASFNKLQQFNEQEGLVVSVQTADRVSHRQYAAQIVREPDAWVAQETGLDGRIFTQARVGLDGSTTLTLDFRHLSEDRNPQIIVNPRLPEATAITFNLLVDAVTKARQ